MTDDKKPTCAHCGGLVEIRNPSGGCDHLYWPDNLTDEAKLANGYKPHQTIVWIKTVFGSKSTKIDDNPSAGTGGSSHDLA